MNHATQCKFASAQQEQEIWRLRDLSARVGSDPLLIQASNGNTSIKLDGVLWIKASGKWLANAMQEDLLMPLQLAEVNESLENDTELAPRRGWESKLRPSIETAMHATLRHRVVIHVHSINTIAWAIRLDGPERLKERLAGLRWQWIPYAASGVPLAREIQRAVRSAPETDVLVLGNHGLVVCGDDCTSAEKLLQKVEQRLAIRPRPVPGPDTAALTIFSRFSKWQFPTADSMHALGTDAVSLRILKGGVLYPCQAMFLGERLPLLPRTTADPSCVEQLIGKEKAPPFIAVESGGVMLNKNMTSAEQATLIGLVQVTQRTEERTPIRYLNAAEIAGVISNGAYGYNGDVGNEEEPSAATAIEKLEALRPVESHKDACVS